MVLRIYRRTPRGAGGPARKTLVYSSYAHSYLNYRSPYTHLRSFREHLRCAYPECNGVVTYEQPVEGNKPRLDKEFCSVKWRVYNHRLKKRIESARH